MERHGEGYIEAMAGTLVGGMTGSIAAGFAGLAMADVVAPESSNALFYLGFSGALLGGWLGSVGGCWFLLRRQRDAALGLTVGLLAVLLPLAVVPSSAIGVSRFLILPPMIALLARFAALRIARGRGDARATA